MILLYQFPTAFGLPNLSPFCFKVETYLRMTDEPFATRVTAPQRAPLGKLPFIDDDGRIVADSAAIVEHLRATRGDKLDAGLSELDRARGHVLRRMVEEAFYFHLLYARWTDDEGFLNGAVPLFAELPPGVRALVPRLARHSIVKQTRAQGTGRHPAEEVYASARRDLAALSALLGESAYFLGDTPRSVDASLYAFLEVARSAPQPAGLAGAVGHHPNLVAYCERMKDRYFAPK